MENRVMWYLLSLKRIIHQMDKPLYRKRLHKEEIAQPENHGLFSSVGNFSVVILSFMILYHKLL